jgi:hypothetical protein
MNQQPQIPLQRHPATSDYPSCSSSVDDKGMENVHTSEKGRPGTTISSFPFWDGNRSEWHDLQAIRIITETCLLVSSVRNRQEGITPPIPKYVKSLLDIYSN